jgi:hypothetical protein
VYRFVHQGSVVTPEQLGVLKQYLHPSIPNKPAAAADISAADLRNEGFLLTTGSDHRVVNPTCQLSAVLRTTEHAKGQFQHQFLRKKTRESGGWGFSLSR